MTVVSNESVDAEKKPESEPPSILDILQNLLHEGHFPGRLSEHVLIAQKFIFQEWQRLTSSKEIAKEVVDGK